MSSNNKEEFDVLKVIELARQSKYEITSAGFATLDKIDKINTIPKKMKTRKHAVQALFSLSENLVKFDYFSPEERRKLLQEAGMSDAPYRMKNIFGNSSAPVTDEDTEEDDIPEEISKPPVQFGEDEEGFEETDMDEMEEDDDFDDDSDSDERDN